MNDLTYSTPEVCRAVGITYRMLDYWCRTGKVVIEDPLPGSGRPRRWTTAEVRKLQEVVVQYHRALEILHDFQTGELWRQAS